MKKGRTVKVLGLVVVLLLAGLVYAACCPDVGPETTPTPSPTPQALSGFDDFEAMGLAALQTLQVKLTYVGEQGKSIPTVAFTAHGHVLNMDCFKPFRNQGVYYGNDELPSVLTFTVAPEELQGMIAALAHGLIE